MKTALEIAVYLAAIVFLTVTAIAALNLLISLAGWAGWL